AIEASSPLVNAVTNNVTINDVANIMLYWGGLPVMAEDRRDVGDMVATADGCLLNTGDVSPDGEATMLTAGRAAAEHGLPVVLDPVGAGATPTRSRVADRLLTELGVTILKGNHGEISAIAGMDATVRGVEAVGEYGDIAEQAVACARETGAIVIASGATDIVADGERAYEVDVGDPMMGRFVGSGCTLGATAAVFAAALEDPLEAALAATAAFGVAGERAAAGDYAGPASYRTAFFDTIADLDPTAEETAGVKERISRVIDE
ncbi:MAG: hydroxyethylthiazole kinase, partial [Salinarchaeum sp.]